LDLSGRLWIGSGGNGISKLDSASQGFALYQYNATDANSLSDNDVRAIFEDRFGNLWIGTWGGLNHLDSQTGRLTQYLHDPADAGSLSDNHIISIEEDYTGALWVGVDTHGLNRFDRQTGRFTHFKSDPSNPDSLSDGVVISLYSDRSGVLWIGTWSGGLDALDLKSTQDGQAHFTHFRHDPDDAQSLGEGIVYSILEDQDGVLWVGTGSGGLCRLDRDTETFACYEHDPQDDNTLSNNTIWVIHQDHEGALWLGTSGGLNRLDPRTGKFVYFNEADGLPHEVIYGIMGDKEGRLWLSTGNGLSLFDPQERTFRNFEKSDGLQGNNFNFGAYHKSSQGKLFFGGPNGLTAFYPADIQVNPHMPPVYITGFHLSNEPVPIGGESPLQQSILDTQELVLSHDERVISFEFTALNFTSPQKNRYRYKLEGFDDRWTEMGSDRRRATYTNLDPGEYTFRIIASNNDGLWNEEGASIHLKIKSPWWETWLFRSAALLTLGGLLTGAYHWRIRSLESSRRKLKHEVSVATRDLGERVKELNCLYAISRLAGTQDISLDEILQGTVELIPPSWQYPQIACARIVLDDREYRTDPYTGFQCQLCSDIMVYGKQSGMVEVAYMEATPESDEGPFLQEERDLLNAIAERLGSIIERKQAEQQLRFQSHLLEAVEQAVIVTDFEGYVIYWNPFAEWLYGWSAEEAMGRRTRELELISDEDAQQQNAEIMACMQAGESWSGEYNMRCRNGTLLPVETTLTPITNSAGELTHIIGLSYNITERKKSEEALAESEKQYRDLVERVSDVIYTVDTDGVITYLNPAIETLLGLLPEEVVGQPFGGFIHPEDVISAQDNAQKLLSGVTVDPAEYRMITSAGETRWIRVMSQSNIEGGQITGFQGVLTDITDRKILEDQIEEHATSAERQRLAIGLHDTVTQSLYSINLQSDATLMALSSGNYEIAKQRLGMLKQIAQEAMNEMRLLIHQLHPPIVEEVGLALALQQRLDAVETRSGISADLQVKGDQQLPLDSEISLFQIALEGLNNVLKHAKASEIQIRLIFEADRCRLTIQDNGVGFEPESIEDYGGYGLANMRDRLEKINGALTIDSRPGKGTTLDIEVIR
jgi:PAS domain S-box-containing protein